ncbi:hypothetical protein ACJMK2_044009, partial [Sinanodonta woodiana]
MKGKPSTKEQCISDHIKIHVRILYGIISCLVMILLFGAWVCCREISILRFEVMQLSRWTSLNQVEYYKYVNLSSQAIVSGVSYMERENKTRTKRAVRRNRGYHAETDEDMLTLLGSTS